MNPSAPPASRSWLRRAVNRLEVDRATFYSIAARVWQLAAGPVSLVVIAVSLSPELQGYYYTFASLMALHTLIELGLHGVMINVASHEWSALHLNSDGFLIGDSRALARLAWLARFARRWYGTVAVLFVIAVGAAGFVFLNQRPAPLRDWLWQWFGMVLLTGGVLWLWGFTALLEGCNQVAAVHRVRLLQAVSGSVVVWATLLAGCGLWAVVASALLRLLWDAWLVGGRYRRFFQTLWKQSAADSSLDWSAEVWPLQWRVGIRAIVTYFAFSLFTPILFQYQGPEAAGKLGMTWTVLTAMEYAAFAWVQTRTAQLGMLVARRDFRELDRVFFRVTGISWALLFAGGVVLCAIVACLDKLPWELAHKLSDRMLPVGPTALFCLAIWLFHIPKCQGVYLLVHKRDPLLWLGTLTSLLVALAVWMGGRGWGATGEAVGYLAVMALLYIPLWTWLWSRCRREWHAEAPLGTAGAP